MSLNGFRSDQFFNVGGPGQADEGLLTGGGVNHGIASPNNPPFIYPNREIVTQGADGKITRVKMQRGYIRTLNEFINGVTSPIRKCQFQFNPQYLSTSVQMSTDVLNSFQQDIGQFAQPLAANSNFLFQLFFDRSMELNNSSGVPVLGNADTSNIFVGDNADPGTIGVFRDVGELNAIIGAGLSPDLQDYATQVAKNQLNAQANSAQQAGNAPTDAEFAAANAGLSSWISPANYGNSAFLLPQPVRVVFSSLFMVEGFVTNVDINYTKFTTTLVPMQATVTLTMNALYIGFAKKTTYVTQQIQAGITAFQQQQQQTQTVANDMTSALQQSMSRMGLSVTAGTFAPVTDGTLGLLLGVNNTGTNFNSLNFRLYSPSIVTSTFDPTAAAVTVPATDAVETVITTSKANVTFTGNALVSILGPFNTQVDANNAINQGVNTAAVPSGPIGVIGNYFLNVQGTYDELSTGSAGPAGGGQVQAFQGGAFPPSYSDGSKWYTVGWTINLTATFQGNTIRGSGNLNTVQNQITTSLSTQLPMKWIGAVVPGTGSPATASTGGGGGGGGGATPPVVSSDNAATADPAPGNSSGVGNSSGGGGVNRA